MNVKLLVLLNLLTISQSHLVQRIVGGHQAKKHEFPNLVALIGYDDDPMKFQIFGGGTILNENWILSSGNCADTVHEIFDIQHVKVMAGLWNLTKWEPSGQVVDIIRAIAHKMYKRGEINAMYDIGLIGLAKSLRINEWVKPFPLSNLTDFVSGKAIIAGWGIQGDIFKELVFTVDIIRTVDVEIIDQGKCREALKNYMEKSQKRFHENYVNDKLICTSSTDAKSACRGDGGGPLMIKNSADEYEVIGIISFLSYPCGVPGNPTLNTKIPCYFTWIDETIKKNPLNIAATTNIAVH